MMGPEMSTVPIEDHAGDCIAKAVRGHKLRLMELLRQNGLGEVSPEVIFEGRADPRVYERLAPLCHLDAGALRALAEGSYHAPSVRLAGLEQVALDYDGMCVNAYLAWDPLTREGVVFDTAGHPVQLAEAVARLRLKVRAVLLTHEHEDHIDGAEELGRLLGVDVWLAGAAGTSIGRAFESGACWDAGGLTIRAVATPGHSAGGTTFVIEGLARPVAVVGDAIFAGSAGGCREGFAAALQTVRERILSLPGETILAPGHGPCTTVYHEQQHNPFFASFVNRQE